MRSGLCIASLPDQRRFPFAGFNHQGDKIISTSNKRSAKIWDAFKGTCIGILFHENADPECAAFSPQDNRIVVAVDKYAYIWDEHLCRGQVYGYSRSGIVIAMLIGHTDAIKSVKFNPPGDKIITASSDKTAKIWDAVTGNCLRTLTRHSNELRFAEFSHLGNVVTVASHEPAIIWDADGNYIATTSSLETVKSAQFSNQGDKIVTTYLKREENWNRDDYIIKIYSALDGSCIVTIPQKQLYSPLYSAKFNSQGNEIVTATAFVREVIIWYSKN